MSGSESEAGAAVSHWASPSHGWNSACSDKSGQSEIEHYASGIIVYWKVFLSGKADGIIMLQIMCTQLTTPYTLIIKSGEAM